MIELPQEAVETFLSQAFDPSQNVGFEVVDRPLIGLSEEFQGNVRFPKDVVTNGTTLWIKGAAHFQGAVKNVTVVALGKIVMEQECVGTQVHCLDSIALHSAKNADIYSFKDIHLKVESERSFLTAAGTIYGETASVRGGHIGASKNIILGNAHSLGLQARLRLDVGDRRLQVRKLQLLEKNIASMEEEYLKIKTAVQAFVKTLIAKNLLGKPIPEFEAMKVKQAESEKKLQDAKAFFEQYKEENLKNRIPGTITIKGNISGEVGIEIEGVHYETPNSGLVAVQFAMDDDSIFYESIGRSSN